MNQYTLSPSPFNQIYQDTIDTAVEEFEKYFDIKLPLKLCLIFLNSRQQFDDIIGRETKPFETGYSTFNLIFMMAEDVYEQQSNKKFNLQKNLLTLRHEVCHKYYQKLAWTTQPVWLNEGLAIYLSGQLSNHNQVETFSNFLLFKSSNFIDGKDVYEESGFVVEKLILKFGKEKLFDFIKLCRNNSGDEEFNKHFLSVYGLELNYDNLNNL
jgi:hypothetical protein